VSKTRPSTPLQLEAPPKVLEAFTQLRALLEDANQLAQVLETHSSRLKATSSDPSTEEQILALEEQLRATTNDQAELTEKLIEAEQQAGKLTSLYVATYQLHVSLDPAEVQTAIAEITRDLLGADTFALLIKDEVDGGCEIALSQGTIPEGSPFSGRHYEGGNAMVDATLEDGHLRLEDDPASTPLAAVPLRVEEAIVGALVILKMLDHKTTPLSEDRDILDLLAAHAASALFAARVYSKTDRKLRTLQSLVSLIRGT
jgi:hypothetical protein